MVKQWVARTSVYFAFAVCLAVQAEKRFIHMESLKNMKYPDEVVIHSFKLPSVDAGLCEEGCQMDQNCRAFSIDTFSANCSLYNPSWNAVPIYSKDFQLHVLFKPESDRYYLDEVDEKYIKLIFQPMKSFYGANKFCEEENGILAPVMNQHRNDLMVKIMKLHLVWAAFIGLTDQDKEEEWIPTNGKKSYFDSWAQEGKWKYERKNCAIINIIGEWIHEECHSYHNFFCEYPLY